MKLTIDGKEVEAKPGETILNVARRAGIEIPALCAEPRLAPFDSCGVCAVEVEGKGVVKACSTPVAEGMVVLTRSERAEEVRRTALELLLSAHWGDCIAPCQLACPAHTDCQGYVGLTANGLYLEALKLLYEKLPLPATLGRICPAPCEEACRRGIVDSPVQIRRIKRFLADLGLDYVPPVGRETGFRVAVVGGGPAGLSCAYFLRRLGHEVVVFEAQEKLGGMLRYGIPAFRLPDEVLDREVAVLARMGIEFRTGVQLGRDIAVSELERDFHAVFLGLGAWKSRRLRIPGEEHQAVWMGIEFLREVKTGGTPALPSRVVVIGGGNTAVDAARTARRLGAEVTVLYRRGREEMPADPQEVKEAEEEGVRFEFLTQPVAFLPAGKWLQGVQCVRMELGEPDSSGRRRPVPIPDSEFLVPAQGAIVAVGQVPDASFLAEEGFELGRGGVLSADQETGQTTRPKVFAGGDLVTGPGIAVEAIAAGRRSALAIDRFLRGLDPKVPEPYVHEKKDVQREDLGEVEPFPPVQPKIRAPQKRVLDFSPYESTFTRKQARTEASRCLECGCQAAFSCLLRDFASSAKAQQDRYEGEVRKSLPDRRHPFIVRDPGKCILCGRCVRVCSDLCGIHAIDFVKRGFHTEVQAPFNSAWQHSDCVSCGACVDACPTGALEDRRALAKQTPVLSTRQESTCTLCDLLCPIQVESLAGHFLRVVAKEGEILCAKGRYGWQVLIGQDRVTRPLVRRNGRLRATDWEEALKLVASRLENGNVGLWLDGSVPQEEAQLWARLAQATGATKGMGLAIDRSLSTEQLAPISALDEADLVIAVGPRSRYEGFILGVRLRRAKERGVRVFSVFRGLDKVEEVPWTARGRKKLEGFLKEATRPALVFEEAWATDRTFTVIEELARLQPRLSIVTPRSNVNLRGLLGLGFPPGPPDGCPSNLLVVGHDPAADPRGAELLGKVKFLVAVTPCLNKTARLAQVVLPMALPLESGGTVIPAGSEAKTFAPTVPSPFGVGNVQVVRWLLEALGEGVQTSGTTVEANFAAQGIPCLKRSGLSNLVERGLRRKGIRAR